MSYSIYSEKLFPVRNRTNRKELVSLLDIISRSDLLAFDYPMALMNVFSRFLVTGLLEAALSNKQIRLDKETWDSLVENNDWPDALLEAIENPPSGFSLYGDTAFLQMPNQVFDLEQDSKKPVDQLLQPFQVAGDTTKGLRQQGEKLDCLCSSCALAGLFVQHFYTAAVSKYWSTSAVNGALLFSPVTINGSLRATQALHLINAEIFQRMLDSKQLSKEHFQRMPWVSNQYSDKGLDDEQILPLEAWLNPEQQRGHLVDSWLPFVRAIRLNCQDVDIEQACDLCGTKILKEQHCIDGFYIKDEPAVLGLLSERIRQAYINNTTVYMARFKKQEEGEKNKAPSAFNFKRLYRQDIRHPALAYRDINDKKARILVEAFQNNYVNRRPNWADLLSIKDKNRPILLKQIDDVTGDTQQVGIELVGLSYKKGRDIDNVTHGLYSFDLLLPVFEDIKETTNEDIIQPLTKHTQTVYDILEQIKKQNEKEKDNSRIAEQINEAEPEFTSAINGIREIKQELATKNVYLQDELIVKAEAFEQGICHIQNLTNSSETLDIKAYKKSTKDVSDIHLEIRQFHEHYACDLIAHTDKILKALQEAGKVLGKKTEPDYKNAKRPYKITTSKRTDNHLSRAPQFMPMADTLWQQTFESLIDIAKQPDKTKKQDGLYEKKQSLYKKGFGLLQQYLDNFPLDSTELVARFLENEALLIYNKKMKGK